MDIALSYDVIGAAMEVHSALGPGLLESLYKKALCKELQLRGHDVKMEYPVKVFYKGEEIGHNLKVDLLVDGELVVELKSVEDVHPVFFKQTTSYLRILNKKFGLLINFNEISLKEGIHRVVNPYYSDKL